MKTPSRFTAWLATLMLWTGGAHAQSQPIQLELPRLDGSAFVRLDDFKGRPVLLNFWGSECPPCLREMPMLFAQARRHAGVQFLGIAVDRREAARRFIDDRSPTYPQLIASTQPEALLRRLGNKVGGLPYTLMLDARHAVCASRLGEVDEGWMDEALQRCGAGSVAGAAQRPPP